MTMVKLYVCYELAKAFLSDEPELDKDEARNTLASAIQLTIEDEIEFMRETKAAGGTGT